MLDKKYFEYVTCILLNFIYKLVCQNLLNLKYKANLYVKAPEKLREISSITTFLFIFEDKGTTKLE